MKINDPKLISNSRIVAVGAIEQSKFVRSPVKLSFSQNERYPSELPSGGLIDIGTPSTQINQSSVFSSRQSNVRGFFLREQLSREDAWRQNEFKRKTREILDQQIEEKKAINRNNSREMEILKFQELNIQKQNKLLDRIQNTQESKQRATPTPIITTNQEDFDSYSAKQSRNSMQSHSLNRNKERFDHAPRIDLIQIQEIMKENEQLKSKLTEKQQVIESLIRQKRENVREQALHDIQENDFKPVSTNNQSPQRKQSVNKRKVNYLSPTAKFVKDKETSQRREHPNNKQLQYLPNKKLNLNYVVSLSSSISSQNQGQSSQQHTFQNQLTDLNEFRSSHDNPLTSVKSFKPITTAPDVPASYNNFTFANNLVDKLFLQQNSQQSSKREATMKFLKEFSQDNLRKRFCT